MSNILATAEKLTAEERLGSEAARALDALAVRGKGKTPSEHDELAEVIQRYEDLTSETGLFVLKKALRRPVVVNSKTELSELLGVRVELLDGPEPSVRFDAALPDRDASLAYVLTKRKGAIWIVVGTKTGEGSGQGLPLHVTAELSLNQLVPRIGDAAAKVMISNPDGDIIAEGVVKRVGGPELM